MIGGAVAMCVCGRLDSDRPKEAFTHETPRHQKSQNRSSQEYQDLTRRITRSEPEGANPEIEQILRAQLFAYSASEELVEYLADLSQEESNLLARTLEDFRYELDEHEARNAEIVFESSSKVSFLVPALFHGPEATDVFEVKLAEFLGVERASDFMNASSRDLEGRFAFWGAAEQEIDIDLSRNPPFVTQRLRRKGKLSTYGTGYSGDRHRFAHFFDVLNPNE